MGGGATHRKMCDGISGPKKMKANICGRNDGLVMN